MTCALSNPYADPVATLREMADVLAFASSGIPWPEAEPEYRLSEDALRGQRYLLEALRDLTRNLTAHLAEKHDRKFREQRPGFMEGDHIDFENETSCILKLMADHARFHHTEGFLMEDVDRGRGALLDFIGDRMAVLAELPHAGRRAA